MRERTARGWLSWAAAGKGLSCVTAMVILCLSATGGYGFSSSQLDQVRTTNRCEACDLSGADFTKAIMNDAQLAGAKMAGARMTGVDLSSANLSGADLSHADLSQADLVGADFSKADMSDANLAQSRLSWAKLTGADLSRANLTGATMASTELAGAKLSGATWVDGKICKEGSVGGCKSEPGEPAQKTKPGRGPRGFLQSPLAPPAGE